MTGFTGVKEYAACDAAGRTAFGMWRKIPSQATTAGWWADLSMAAGTPVPNYYAATPLKAKTLEGFDGIFHGDAKSPASMHLTGLGVMTPTAAFVGRFTLLDYLMYYPFIDGDATGELQSMDNATTLPRYTTGAGVRVMAVAVAPTTGGGTFTFDYVNQDGVAKTSPVQYCSTAASIATIVSSQPAIAGVSGPFLNLDGADTGVRSITSVTFTVANGGLIALVLVKPLADLAIREINTVAEMPMVSGRPGSPQINDGAYLGLICQPAGSIAAGVLTGYATFAWSE